MHLHLRPPEPFEKTRRSPFNRNLKVTCSDSSVECCPPRLKPTPFIWGVIHTFLLRPLMSLTADCRSETHSHDSFAWLGHFVGDAVEFFFLLLHFYLEWRTLCPFPFQVCSLLLKSQKKKKKTQNVEVNSSTSCEVELLAQKTGKLEPNAGNRRGCFHRCYYYFCVTRWSLQA